MTADEAEEFLNHRGTETQRKRRAEWAGSASSAASCKMGLVGNYLAADFTDRSRINPEAAEGLAAKRRKGPRVMAGTCVAPIARGRVAWRRERILCFFAAIPDRCGLRQGGNERTRT